MSRPLETGAAPPLHLARPPRAKRAPCDRVEGVVFDILRDASRHDFRRDLKYSVPAVIEKVIFRRQSVASCGRAPSYLWITLDLDEDGAPWPDTDYGAMPHEVLCPPALHKWGKLKGQPDFARRRWRISMPAHEGSEMGPWSIVSSDHDHGRAHDFALHTGISIGTRFLLRVAIAYSTSYEGETDCDITSSILFVDSAPEYAHLPVRLDDEIAAAIGGRLPNKSKWSVQE
ncbi:MAG: hypothetical protein KDJ44_01470 [Rhodoblastus sp.]|nr:hypothetical protein [Rhodoblastus sp.]MCC2106131.1 hypothetical protein [Hyphomicrobiales bacterium]